MHPRITIKDIAALSGVSAGTVDRVIHGRGNVSRKARELVEQAMRELNYEPNLIASTLAYNRTLKITALIPDYRSDPYWEQPKSGIEKASLAVRHYGVQVEFVYFPMFSPSRFLKEAEEIIDANPDVLLFAPLFREESGQILRRCAARKIPAALINTDLEDQEALCYVGQDSFQSGVLAGKLLHFGLRPGDMVAVINLDKQIMHARHLLEKERGLRAYFSRHPWEDIGVIRADFEHFEDPQAMQEFLSGLLNAHSRLKGLFISNSRSYRILDAMAGLERPRLRLVGFDLLPANLAYLESNQIDFLINQNPVQQGYQAVMSIFNHLILRKKVERVQYLPLDIVVSENYSYYVAKEKGFQVLV
ncbi:MAG: substrate-binding domain-containing protein [Haliscomenobacter sp.]|nr:substrate-binding domain-containing protein [Haliscomenobacter sp.]